MDQAEYKEKISAPVMHIPEQNGGRIDQHEQADRSIGVINIEWNCQNDT